MTREGSEAIGEWREVRRRNNHPVVQAKTEKKVVPIWKNCYSFFVANLPETCSAEDLRKAYGGFGEMVDAFVSKKKDRGGCTFGFIRFGKQSDLQNLLSELNKVVMENRKPYVSLPRFDRAGNEISYCEDGSSRQAATNHGGFVRPSGREGGNVKAGRSFREVLIQSKPLVPCVKVIEEDEQRGYLDDSLANSLLGYLKDLEQLNKIKSNLLSLGKKGMSLIYLGGLRVLVSFRNADDAIAILSNKIFWGKWFSSLCWWEKQRLEFERVAWIKICGIPPHLWSASLSDLVAARFGEVVQGSTACPEVGNFAFDVVGILVKTGLSIAGVVSVSHTDSVYEVWIQELYSEWLPDNFYVQKSSLGSESEFMKDSDDATVKSVEAKDDSESQQGSSRKSGEGLHGDLGEGTVSNVRDHDGVRRQDCGDHYEPTIDGAIQKDKDVNQNEVMVEIQNLEVEGSNLREHEDGGTLGSADPFDVDRFIWDAELQNSRTKENLILEDNIMRVEDPGPSNGGEAQQMFDLNKSLPSSSEFVPSVSDVSLEVDRSSSPTNHTPVPKQAEKTQVNKKGQKKGGKKATKKKNDINWTSFIDGISSPEESVTGVDTRTSNQTAIEIEIQETMRVGEKLGINLTGFEDRIEALIRGEGDNNFF